MITHYNHSDFTLESIENKLDEYRINVVFSTYGEREADLIHEKIVLIKSQVGHLMDRIILSHRRSGTEPERTESRAREAFDGTEILICNHASVPDMGDEGGKGADMRRALYHINTLDRDYDPAKVIVVFLDADVLPDYFGIHFVTGLVGTVLNGHDFAKASFWRAMGRVRKYVAQPLFSVVDHPLLADLQQFHYPLSGEVAGTLSFFNEVSFWQRYGIETGMLIDGLMNRASMADVNLGLYDHEHQDEGGIARMSFGIIRTYLKQLESYGLLQLANGASISNIFQGGYIDKDKTRKSIDSDLTELKYEPLGRLFA